MNAPVQQKPLVETAQATQLSRRRARFDAVVAKIFKECSHILLNRLQEYAVPAFDELRKGPQVA